MIQVKDFNIESDTTFFVKGILVKQTILVDAFGDEAKKYLKGS